MRWLFKSQEIAVALATLLCLQAGVPATGRCEEQLLMVFREKPPYSYTEHGVQKGFLLERTRQILDKARVQASFEIMPPKRIFAEIEADTRAICSFGWYKTPEREKYALYTRSIHKDRPHILLAAPASTAAIGRHATLKNLLADNSLTLALVDGTSYGPELDKMIASFPGKIDRALISPLQVARKIAANRADFMFIDQDDYEYMLATEPEFKKNRLVKISFPDMPPGLLRYILCSRKTGNNLIERLNAGIVGITKNR